MVVKLREGWNYYTPDGTRYPLTVPSKEGRWVISDGGLGVPPIDYITQRGPQQHGETVHNFFLLPRTIQLFIRHGFCSRDAYWTGRSGLLNVLRPNRSLTELTSPGLLEKILPDGSIRRIEVYISEGPQFAPSERGRWDEWAFNEVLRFTAYNPIFYDPSEQTVSFVSGDQLVFPITFPIIFSSVQAVGTATYDGTWDEYPTIEIRGPILGPAVENVTTGERIGLDYNVAEGQTIYISLNGDKTVLDNTDANLIGVVTPDSDLAGFHIAPHPHAPDGINTIKVYGTGTGANTSISIRFYNRYFGI